MPRDQLDGITTRSGRVVYDRKKHLFTVKDVERILKKSLPREIPEPTEENKWFYEILWEIIEELLQFLLTNKESKWTIAILIAMAKVIDSVVNVCNDDDWSMTPNYQTGGAGASGPF